MTPLTNTTFDFNNALVNVEINIKGLVHFQIKISL